MRIVTIGGVLSGVDMLDVKTRRKYEAIMATERSKGIARAYFAKLNADGRYWK